MITREAQDISPKQDQAREINIKRLNNMAKNTLIIWLGFLNISHATLTMQENWGYNIMSHGKVGDYYRKTSLGDIMGRRGWFCPFEDNTDVDFVF